MNSERRMIVVILTGIAILIAVAVFSTLIVSAENIGDDGEEQSSLRTDGTRGSNLNLFAIYVGNTLADLQWTEWGGEFKNYTLEMEDGEKHAFTNRSTTFYRWENLTKGSSYTFILKVHNTTGVEVDKENVTVKAGDVEGTITKDTTWKKSQSSYVLVSGLKVGSGANLTIDKGVAIDCEGHLITIEGKLSNLDTIIWNGSGIEIIGATNFTMKNCTINRKNASEEASGFIFDDCNGVKIENNRFYEFSTAGIKILNSNDPTIKGNIFNGTGTEDLYLEKVTYGNMSGNNGSISMLESTSLAIRINNGLLFMRDCQNNFAQNNNFSGNQGWGVKLSSSNGNYITDNLISFNTDGGLQIQNGNRNEIKKNTIANNTGTGIQVSGDANRLLVNKIINTTSYGIWISGPQTFVEKNTITNTGFHAIYQNVAIDCNITGNEIDNCTNGIHLEPGSGETDIGGNSLRNCIGTAIWLRGSQLCIIQRNIIHDSITGISLHLDSPHCHIENNTIYDLTGYGNGIVLDQRCHNVTIEHNNLDNLTGNGIDIQHGSDHCELSWNGGEDSLRTVYLRAVKNITIHNSTNERLTRAGIEIVESAGIIVKDSSFIDMPNEGIRIDDSERVTVSNCTFKTGSMKGISFWEAKNNIVNNNSFTGISSGITLWGSSQNEIRDNGIKNNSEYGMNLWDSSNNKLMKNTISQCMDSGIRLWESHLNTLENNTIEKCGKGIHFQEYSANNTIHTNVVRNNTQGIYFWEFHAPKDNTIYNNRLENPINAHDQGANSWNITLKNGTNIMVGFKLGGNFWSSYNGEDNNSDGIGDTLTPHDDNGNILIGGDQLPLMASVANIWNIDTDERFWSIQEALDDNDTLNGHTINIPKGIWEENVRIRKEVKITGGEDAVIKAKNPDDRTVDIHAGNVTIIGLTITGSTGKGGIYVWGSSNLLIENTILQGNLDGVNIFDGSKVTLKNCKIMENTKNGTVISFSNNITMEKCEITKNKYAGVLISDCPDSVKITECNIESNDYFGILGERSTRIFIEKNFRISSPSEIGISLTKCEDCHITDNPEIENNFAGGILLEECWMVSITRNTIRDNTAFGIGLKKGTYDCMIGGAAVDDKNIISNNEKIGVLLDGSGTKNNHLSGNFIGTDATGMETDPNGEGIFISNGASFNIIGIHNTVGFPNVISGNKEGGITISGKESVNNIMKGNIIGPAVTGKVLLKDTNSGGEQPCGIFISNGANRNVIGGSGPSDRNIISGPISSGGISIAHEGTSFNTIVGNYFGTDITGTKALSFGNTGITIGDKATFNTIGGNAPGEGNLICGNNGDNDYAVGIFDPGTQHNTIIGNRLGSFLTTGTKMWNCIGVRIENGASYNTIINNEIGNSDRYAIDIFSGEHTVFPLHNVISGNFIGIDRTGTIIMPNNAGIRLWQTNDNVVQDNVIGQSGIAIAVEGGTRDNRIENNFIGTDRSKTRKMGNHVGIHMSENAGWNHIRANYIYYNNRAIEDISKRFKLIEENYIVGNNGSTGIYGDGSVATFIGNIIIDNNHGVLFENGSAPVFQYNTIMNNTGYDINNTAPHDTIDMSFNYWGPDGPESAVILGHVDTGTPLLLPPHSIENGSMNGTGTISFFSERISIVYNSTGLANITITEFNETPLLPLSGDLGIYFALSTPESENLLDASITVRLYEDELPNHDMNDLRVFYWDGMKWSMAGVTAFSDANPINCTIPVTITLYNGSIPDILQLEHLVLTVAFTTQDPDQVEIDEDDDEGYQVWFLLVFILIAGLIIYVFRTEFQTGDEEGDAENGPSPEEMNKKEMAEKLGGGSSGSGTGDSNDGNDGETDTGGEGGMDDEIQNPEGGGDGWRMIPEWRYGKGKEGTRGRKMERILNHPQII